MTKIDIISGFLGAGKTTLIKKLLKEAFNGEKVVLIENEFGEIGVDGGFLKEAGIEIKEMNSGCICCSLVGDFGTSLKEVLETYHPERIIIEPSGVGKLSDVAAAVENVKFEEEVKINSTVAVVDATKCKMYMKNFGEFFLNQIQHAGTVILSRTAAISEEKLKKAVDLIREQNDTATIITTDWELLEGTSILHHMEKRVSLEEELLQDTMENHHDHEEGCCCGHDHHEHEEHHHHAHEEGCCCGHDHHEHEEHHHHAHEEGCCCGHDHHEHEEHHHDHEEGCSCCGHDHHEHEEHHHDHEEGCSCGCGHEHHNHHASEVFTSWGKETPVSFSKEQIEEILEALEDDDRYGMVLRAKGMVKGKEAEEWIYFDYVPGEVSVRSGKPEVTGKICVIGSNIKEDNLGELFGV